MKGLAYNLFVKNTFKLKMKYLKNAIDMQHSEMSPST